MTLLDAKNHVLEFGVHKGQTLAHVAETDPTYIDWLAGETWPDLFLNEALPLVLQHYGRRPKQPKPATGAGQLGLAL